MLLAAVVGRWLLLGLVSQLIEYKLQDALYDEETGIKPACASQPRPSCFARPARAAGGCLISCWLRGKKSRTHSVRGRSMVFPSQAARLAPPVVTGPCRDRAQVHPRPLQHDRGP